MHVGTPLLLQIDCMYLQGGKEGLFVSILMYSYSRRRDMLLQEQSGAVQDVWCTTPSIPPATVAPSVGTQVPSTVPLPAFRQLAMSSGSSAAITLGPSPASLEGWTFPVTRINQKCLGRFPSSAILLLVFTATVTNSCHLYPARAVVAAAWCLSAHGAFW